MKDVNIEDVFFPENNKLTRHKNGTISIKIIDAELDPVLCEFNFDDCVKIDTKDYSYLTLSRNNLYKIIDALEEAEEIFWDEFNNKKINKNE